MLPVVKNIESQNTTDTIDSEGIVYKFNFDDHAYELNDGKLIELEGTEEKVKQWIQFLLNVELDKYTIYKDIPFGISKNRFVGKKNYPLVLLESDLEDDLKRAFGLNKDIKELIKLSVEKENDTLKIEVHVRTINNVDVEVSNV